MAGSLEVFSGGSDRCGGGLGRHVVEWMRAGEGHLLLRVLLLHRSRWCLMVVCSQSSASPDACVSATRIEDRAADFQRPVVFLLACRRRVCSSILRSRGLQPWWRRSLRDPRLESCTGFVGGPQVSGPGPGSVNRRWRRRGGDETVSTLGPLGAACCATECRPSSRSGMRCAGCLSGMAELGCLVGLGRQRSGAGPGHVLDPSTAAGVAQGELRHASGGSSCLSLPRLTYVASGPQQGRGGGRMQHTVWAITGEERSGSR